MVRRLMDWLVYFLVRVVVCVIQTLRLETCHAAARWIAWLAYDGLRIRGSVVHDNLAHVFPQLSDRQRRRLARAMWEHLVLMVCEVAHVAKTIHETNFRQYITFADKRKLVGYLLQPRPIVLVTGHFGNFEVAGYVAGLLGFPTYTIARPLDNPYLHRWISQFRSAKGQHLLPKDGCAPTVARILDANGTLSLLGDQHAGDRGCWVEFFGRPASCHKAVALFTLSSKAPQLVTYLRRLGRPMHFELGLTGIADPQQPGPHLSNVRALTDWYNRRLEDMILSDPTQYWWLHRRWKGKPAARPKRAA